MDIARQGNAIMDTNKNTNKLSTPMTSATLKCSQPDLWLLTVNTKGHPPKETFLNPSHHTGLIAAILQALFDGPNNEAGMSMGKK